MKPSITTIAFDGDDTLWVNEPYFQESVKEFCALLEPFGSAQLLSEELFKTEMKNLRLYGYGIKGFVLSMIETANIVSCHKVSPHVISKIMAMGHDLLEKPVELLTAVKETLDALKDHYRLVVATKGDLLDQERKLKRSGLESYFHHIEIMSDKKVSNYQELLAYLDCRGDQFLMLGNSLQSDILPVLEIGGYAGHIPYHVTWEHEQYQDRILHRNFIELQSIDQILDYLKSWIKP